MDIVLGRQAISADTALRLVRYFGTTPEFWVDIQARSDLDVAKQAAQTRLRCAPRPNRVVWAQPLMSWAAGRPAG